MIHPSSARRFAVVAAFATIAVGGAAHASQTVIVELDAPPAAVHAAQAEAAGAPLSDAQIDAYRAQLEADQDTFLASLGGAGVAHTVRPATVYGIGGQLTTVPTRYSLVYNGVALVVDEAAIAAIEAMPGVKAVHRETQQKLHLDRAVDYVRAPEVYGAVAEVTPTATANEGLEGRGIYIAVLDSGIDWSHPMFGGDPTPPRLGLAQQIAAVPTNDKIVYYMPLIDGAYDDYGHGTHVAADAAGYLGFEPGPDGIPNTADDVAMHGVAPQARIMGYKVCNAAGTCLNPDTLLAIEDAVSPRTLTGFAKPVAHVINLSLGGEGGPDSPTSVACDNAVLLGAIVVSSAGNEGPGLGTIGALSLIHI